MLPGSDSKMIKEHPPSGGCSFIPWSGKWWVYKRGQAMIPRSVLYLPAANKNPGRGKRQERKTPAGAGADFKITISGYWILRIRLLLVSAT
jgi:hypothetical protein